MDGAAIIRPTGEGFTASCPGSPLVGHGGTESAAWSDLLQQLHARWAPPVPPDGEPRPAAEAPGPPPAPVVWRGRRRPVTTVPLNPPEE